MTRPDPRSLVVVALDYDGNRTVFPDIPLPAITYTRFFSEDLSATVGVPFLGVNWTPGKWDLSAGIFLIQARVRAAYEIDASRSRSSRSTAAAPRRSTSTAPATTSGSSTASRACRSGPTSTSSRTSSLVASVGYAFNHEFETGFDARDLETVRELDPGVFFGLSLGFKF